MNPGSPAPKACFEDFRKFCIANLGLTERTIQSHQGYFNYVASFVRPEAATLKDIQEIVVRRRSEGKTIHNLVKFIRVFYGKYLGHDWAKTFKVPKPVFRVKAIPSRQQLKTFFEALPHDRAKAVFLLLASSGLRLNEALSASIDLEKRMLVPNGHQGETKRSYVSFFNDEADAWLRRVGIVKASSRAVDEWFRDASIKTGLKITPKILREWFCSEMARLGVPDRYVDAYCGRVPQTVLARHYSDYSPETLRQIYSKANLKVLEDE